MMYDYYQTTVAYCTRSGPRPTTLCCRASIGYNNYSLSKLWAFTVQNYLTGLSSVHTLRKSRSCAKHKKPTLSRAGGAKGCANQAV